MGARLQLIDLAQNIAVHPESAALVEPIAKEAFQDIQQRQQEQDRRSSKGVEGQPKSLGDIST
jgi:hypothetical protein